MVNFKKKYIFARSIVRFTLYNGKSSIVDFQNTTKFFFKNINFNIIKINVIFYHNPALLKSKF
jgi:hypothetical protein